MSRPFQALAAHVPGLTFEQTPETPVLRCGQRAVPYALKLFPLADGARPCVCAVSEASVSDDLLLTVWRPAGVPKWTAHHAHRVPTGDAAFDARYEARTLPQYEARARGRLTQAVRAALLRPPEIGLIVGDYGVFLYFLGLAEADVDAHTLAVADNVLPVMLAGRSP